jgi:hypothetical protein
VNRTLCACLTLLWACGGGGAGIGGACKGDGECGGGLTCKPEAVGYPAGLCTADCSSKACGKGNLCTQLAGESVCLQACTKDTECRASYVCCATYAAVCLPTALCNTTAPVCERPVVASTLVPAQVRQFGPHKVGDVIAFDVPPGTGSVTIVHQARAAGLNVTYKGQVIDNSAVPGIINFPDGKEAYNDFTFNPPASPDGGTDSSGAYAFYGGGTPSTAAFTMPNTSASLAAGVPAGTWKFSVNDYAYECGSTAGCTAGASTTNTYDVSVLLRPLPLGTNLDVAFYIVASGMPFTAADAANNVSVKRMLQTFKSLYTAAGINIRNVNFYDVSSANQARFGTNVSADKIGPCDELNQMFLLSAAHPGNTINLFLVQSIRPPPNQLGGMVVGIDGTIPGPSSFGGTVHSGAAVSLADLFKGSCGAGIDVSGCGADVVAYIAAHETGHFLGLFHTTEASGDYFDPIADTPKCPCMSCASSADLAKCAKPDATGPTLQADQCSKGGGCGGGDNLMFWQLFGPYSKGTLSSEQRSVMRLNPLVQ